MYFLIKTVCTRAARSNGGSSPVLSQKRTGGFCPAKWNIIRRNFPDTGWETYAPHLVSTIIRSICEKAQILSEKESSHSLRKMYLSIGIGIENNVDLLVEQAIERMIKQEQFSIGWDE